MDKSVNSSWFLYFLFYLMANVVFFYKLVLFLPVIKHDGAIKKKNAANNLDNKKYNFFS